MTDIDKESSKFNTTNLNLAASLIARGLKPYNLTQVEDQGRKFFNYVLLDANNEGRKLADDYFDRTLTVNVREMFDARSRLISDMRQLEPRQ